MAQPRSYSQTTTFTDHSTVAPNDPHSGANLDTEFVEIKQNLDDLNSNIALLQRDDGKLLNTAVHKDAFDQDALAFIGASGSGFSPKGAWTGLKTTVEITTFASDGGSPAKSLITKSNHGLTDNTVVRLSSSGTLPTGFVTTEDYYVFSSTTTTFKLSGTSGGTPINFTDGGSGTHSYSFPNTYSSGDLVTNNAASYLTVTAHTTGNTFAGDLSTYWTLIANSAIETSSASVNTASGDGSNKVFTTTYTYTDPKDVQVFVNGALQATNLYSITNSGGNNITFTTAPSSGTNNVIIWGATVIAEAAKAGALTYSTTANNHKITASRWATLTTDEVTDAESGADSGDYSAKAYAIGGTEVTGATGKGSAKDWAIGAGGVMATQPDGAEFSAKEYAQGVTATGGTSKEWALKDDGEVITGEFSAKAHASITGSNAPTDGSAKEWATTTASVVADSEYSSKEYALGTTASTGSSKQWALGGGSSFTSTVAVEGSNYSAKRYYELAQAEYVAASAAENDAEIAQGAAEDAQDAAELALATFQSLFHGASTSTPSSNVSDGDLWFDTNTGVNVMKVYNSDSSAWEQLTPSSANQTKINSAVANETNINKVAAIDANVTKVADIDANVTKVANIDSNVTTVAGIGTNGADVTTVAGLNTEIGLLGTSAMATASTGHIPKVAANETNINTVAASIDDVNRYANEYKILATEPGSPSEGDMWSDTSNNVFKVYNGTSWATVTEGQTATEVTTAANNASVSMAIALG